MNITEKSTLESKEMEKKGRYMINGYVVGPGADLENVSLSFSDLTEVDLRGANLKNATISYCKSRFTNFCGAILEQTTFIFSNLEFSNFTNIKGEPIFLNSNTDGIIK